MEIITESATRIGMLMHLLYALCNEDYNGDVADISAPQGWLRRPRSGKRRFDAFRGDHRNLTSWTPLINSGMMYV